MFSKMIYNERNQKKLIDEHMIFMTLNYQKNSHWYL